MIQIGNGNEYKLSIFNQKIKKKEICTKKNFCRNFCAASCNLLQVFFFFLFLNSKQICCWTKLLFRMCKIVARLCLNVQLLFKLILIYWYVHIGHIKKNWWTLTLFAKCSALLFNCCNLHGVNKKHLLHIVPRYVHWIIFRLVSVYKSTEKK